MLEPTPVTEQALAIFFSIGKDYKKRRSREQALELVQGGYVLEVFEKMKFSQRISARKNVLLPTQRTFEVISVAPQIVQTRFMKSVVAFF